MGRDSRSKCDLGYSAGSSGVIKGQFLLNYSKLIFPAVTVSCTNTLLIPFIIALLILFFGLLGHLLENSRNALPLARLLDFNGIWIMSSVEP